MQWLFSASSCLNLFASSINGRFSISDRIFHSAPSLFEISELCIFGFSCEIFLLWPLDQTMNAFMGRLMWSLDLLGLMLTHIQPHWMKQTTWFLSKLLFQTNWEGLFFDLPISSTPQLIEKDKRRSRRQERKM